MRWVLSTSRAISKDHPLGVLTRHPESFPSLTRVQVWHCRHRPQIRGFYERPCFNQGGPSGGHASTGQLLSPIIGTFHGTHAFTVPLTQAWVYTHQRALTLNKWGIELCPSISGGIMTTPYFSAVNTTTRLFGFIVPCLLAKASGYCEYPTGVS